MAQMENRWNCNAASHCDGNTNTNDQTVKHFKSFVVYLLEFDVIELLKHIMERKLIDKWITFAQQMKDDLRTHSCRLGRLTISRRVRRKLWTVGQWQMQSMTKETTKKKSTAAGGEVEEQKRRRAACVVTLESMRSCGDSTAFLAKLCINSFHYCNQIFQAIKIYMQIRSSDGGGGKRQQPL